MKKCKGCGEILQYEDKNALGYAPNVDFDYCQRCFRLTHYGDTNRIKHSLNDNNRINNQYNNYKNSLFVLIVDCFDALIINEDYLLNKFIDKNLLLIINKIDLLPRNINEEKIYEIYEKLLSEYNKNKNFTCVVTYKNDKSFNDLFFDILEEKGLKNIIFVGRANVGKSSLINKLLEDNTLTTSIYAGTTTTFNEIEYNGYTFIDTPGLIDNESIITYLDNKIVKNVLPLKTIKAQSFQLYEDESYSIEGLIDVQISTNDSCSIIFFINNNLEVHRTKLSNINKYFSNNEKNFKLKIFPLINNEYYVKKYKTYYVKGLGMFKIKGNCNVNIRVNDKIKIYENEVNI